MMNTETINSRPEMKRDTLESLMRLKDNPGVYIIECLENGACYAGGTGSMSKRTTGHFSRLNSGCHEAPLLQADWDMYGSEQFKFWFQYVPFESLLDREKQLIILTNGLENRGGYNKALLEIRWVCSRIRDTETKLRRRSPKFIPICSTPDWGRLHPEYIRTFCQTNHPLSAETDMQIELNEKQRKKRLMELISDFQQISATLL